MMITSPAEATGNFAALPPASLDEDPDMIQPASDSPETAVTSANRVKWFYQLCTKMLGICTEEYRYITKEKYN